MPIGRFALAVVITGVFFFTMQAILFTGTAQSGNGEAYALALEKGGPIELRSLLVQFGNMDEAKKLSPPPEDYLDYWSLGKTTLTGEKRDKLASTLKTSLRRVKSGDELPKCFFPRHAVAVTHEGQTYEFVICFECVQARLSGFGGGAFTVARGPESLFDATLKEAKIPLSRDFEKR